MKRLTSFREGHHYDVDPETGCWNWSMRRDRKGYGMGAGPDARAHRSSWIFANGPIPPGKVIDHLCRNKGCVNPQHLDCVRQAENVWRGDIVKITPEIAECIRKRLRDGDTQAQIARDYGVSGHVPFLIAEDRCWRVDPDAPQQPIRVERHCPNCGTLVIGSRSKRFCKPNCRSLFNARARYHRLKAANGAGTRREQQS